MIGNYPRDTERTWRRVNPFMSIDLLDRQTEYPENPVRSEEMKKKNSGERVFQEYWYGVHCPTLTHLVLRDNDILKGRNHGLSLDWYSVTFWMTQDIKKQIGLIGDITWSLFMIMSSTVGRHDQDETVWDVSSGSWRPTVIGKRVKHFDLPIFGYVLKFLSKENTGQTRDTTLHVELNSEYSEQLYVPCTCSPLSYH